MDCRSFREMLDSYLSGELAVETNHDVLRHTEQCAACRTEMGARRHLRQMLRQGGTRVCLSLEGHERLRVRLRAEEAGPRFSLLRLFSPRFRLGLAAAVVLVLLLGGVYELYLLERQSVSAAELSPALMNEAAGDHDNCATKFLHHEGPVRMPESAGQYNPAYADLCKVAGAGAQGLQLRAAHVCGFAGRRFAHLVYTRESQLISLLVTERDRRAFKRGAVPPDDGLRAGLQHALRDRHTVSAYQTAKYIVLIVSDLPEAENQKLTEQVAEPVCQYLRGAESNRQPQPGSTNAH